MPISGSRKSAIDKIIKEAKNVVNLLKIRRSYFFFNVYVPYTLTHLESTQSLELTLLCKVQNLNFASCHPANPSIMKQVTEAMVISYDTNFDFRISYNPPDHVRNSNSKRIHTSAENQRSCIMTRLTTYLGTLFMYR